MIKWISIDFWKYLFKNTGSKYSSVGFFKHLFCKAMGHPKGVIYYTGPLAEEPDMHCKDCGEDLG